MNWFVSIRLYDNTVLTEKYATQEERDEDYACVTNCVDESDLFQFAGRDVNPRYVVEVKKGLF